MDQAVAVEEAIVGRLTRDLARAARTMSAEEARFLVDYYYMSQEDRKRSNNQNRALVENKEPHTIISWLAEQSSTMEQQVKRALDQYTDGNELGAWAKSIVGIGPVIAAGLLAHIDITRAPTVGHIWRFAGLDPTMKWNKGEKRPWNATLKTLTWKIGQSFMKLNGNEECFYGQVYKTRKAFEIERNDRGDNKERAAQILTERKIGKDTDAFAHYTAGHLPPAQIDARARRYAVKLFLAHYHEAAYRIVLKKEPPLPYPIAHLGHVHKIEAPEPVKKSEPVKKRAAVKKSAAKKKK